MESGCPPRRGRAPCSSALGVGAPLPGLGERPGGDDLALPKDLVAGHADVVGRRRPLQADPTPLGLGGDSGRGRGWRGVGRHAEADGLGRAGAQAAWSECGHREAGLAERDEPGHPCVRRIGADDVLAAPQLVSGGACPACRGLPLHFSLGRGDWRRPEAGRRRWRDRRGRRRRGRQRRWHHDRGRRGSSGRRLTRRCRGFPCGPGRRGLRCGRGAAGGAAARPGHLAPRAQRSGAERPLAGRPARRPAQAPEGPARRVRAPGRSWWRRGGRRRSGRHGRRGRAPGRTRTGRRPAGRRGPGRPSSRGGAREWSWRHGVQVTGVPRVVVGEPGARVVKITTFTEAAPVPVSGDP